MTGSRMWISISISTLAPAVPRGWWECAARDMLDQLIRDVGRIRHGAFRVDWAPGTQITVECDTRPRPKP